jgi:hypothetical protein
MRCRSPFLFVAALLLFLSASCQPTGHDQKKSADLISSQLKLLADHYKEAKINPGGVRADAVTVRSLNAAGNMNLIPSKDWCSGFVAGSFWKAYTLTGDKVLMQLAADFTKPLEQEKYNGKTHDMGLKMFCSYGQGYVLTKDTSYRSILIQSAKTLATRFNEKVGAIRSWDHNQDKWQFPVIIDNMMNLELLFWASKETGDQRFYDIAVKHANTTLANHFRPDNSSYHVIGYDTLTGKVLQRNTHQGLSHESAWSRGQAWGLYGYTMCYRETKIELYLQQAEKIAEFVLNHPNLPKDKVPYWDFDAPASAQTPRDASAAAVTASALFELAQYLPAKKEHYLESATAILSSLERNYASKAGENKGFLLGHSTGSFPSKTEVDVPINYADYYYLEAIGRQIESYKKSK